MVPLMHYVADYDFHYATAVSLLVIAIQSPTGVWQHARRGAVDWRVAAPLAVAGIGGVALGVWLEPRVPVPWLKLLLAILMAFAAWRMVARLPTPGAQRRPGLLLLLVTGLFGGVASK